MTNDVRADQVVAERGHVFIYRRSPTCIGYVASNVGWGRLDDYAEFVVGRFRVRFSCRKPD